MPISISVPFLFVEWIRVPEGTYRGCCMGKQVARDRAGGAAGIPRRRGGSASAAGDLRDGRGADLERDRSEAEAERRAGAAAVPAAGPAGCADGGPVLGRLGGARLGPSGGAGGDRGCRRGTCGAGGAQDEVRALSEGGAAWSSAGAAAGAVPVVASRGSGGPRRA